MQPPLPFSEYLNLEMEELMEACKDDLLRDLLLTPKITNTNFINNLLSTIYSGPTINDIETALSASSTYTNSATQDLSPSTRISDMESRVENKYVLKIKNTGNVMADDGYKWRKYGQKSIKNSSNPRSYYKCTNPHCGAKKQVERSSDDPDTLIITYEGLHLHYIYPFFIFGQSENPTPPTKKFRRFDFESGAHQNHRRQSEIVDENIRHISFDQPSTVLTGYKEVSPEATFTSQGLLEDMVPLLIRNPGIDATNTSKSSSSSSSNPSPPASPSFSWPPTY